MTDKALKPLVTVASVEVARFLGPAEGKPHDRTDWPDSRSPGLVLRVTRSGAKSWCLRYRNAGGASRRVTLGSYPALGLAAARKEADRLRTAVASGSDPSAERDNARAEAKRGKVATVEDLISRYLTDAERGDHRPNARAKRASTIALDRYHFDRLIKPRLGSTAVRELSRHDVQAFLDDTRHKHAVSTARHCLAVIRQAFNYAVRKELAPANPAALASLPRQTERERVLSVEELRTIWQATAEPNSSSLAIRLAMVTLQRGGEVAGLHASEVDLEARTWTIPGKRTKNHRTHVVPLSDLAVSILEQAFLLKPAGADRQNNPWTGYAFPGRGKTDKPMTRAAISRALKRIRGATGLADATPHDLRRTGATFITGERIGLPRFIVSRVLNQISDSGGAAAATRIYDRNEYLVEKRRALDAWAAVLVEIVEGKARGSNVTPLAARRG